MPAPDFVALFTTPLETLGVPYMITGATAAIIYGQPRLTNDLDLVLELVSTDIEKLRTAFPDADFHVPSADEIAVEIARPTRAHLNLIHFETGFKADLYPVGADPLHRWAMPRRRRVPHGDSGISVAPPEYVILRKLEYFREGGSAKHVTDIRAMLEISGDQLDRPALTHWLDRLGLNATWQEIASPS
jgi:hypothetical protein